MDSHGDSGRAEGLHPKRVLIAVVAHGGGPTAPTGRTWACADCYANSPRRRVMPLDALHRCPETALLILKLGSAYACRSRKTAAARSEAQREWSRRRGMKEAA